MAIKKTVQDDYLDWCQENMKVFRWVDMQMGRQVDGQIGRWVDRQMGRQLDGQIGRQKYSQLDSQIGRWIVRQICRQLDRKVDSQIDMWKLDIGGYWIVKYRWRVRLLYTIDGKIVIQIVDILNNHLMTFI